MASDHPILGRLEATLSRFRDDNARLHSKKAIIMQFLSEFGTALTTLIGARQASDQRAEAAEAEVATLKQQIAADEATLKSMLDAVNTEVAAEAPPAPVVTTSPSGATVTVDAGAGITTHVDPVAGITTTLDHATGAVTAANAAATPVEPAPAVVAEATAATTAAGVAVPAAS